MCPCRNYVPSGVLKSYFTDNRVQIDTGGGGKPDADVNVHHVALMHAETSQPASETKPWRTWKRVL